MLNMHISLLPQKESDVPELIPSHLTIKALFRYFLDLSSKPQRRFVECLEHAIDETESIMTETLSNTRSYFYWANDKTYASVLLQYKDVVPPIETLISALPPMRPRIYTPINKDSKTKSKKIGICVKLVPGGLCSGYLTGLKKGDRVMVRLAPSTLQRPNETFVKEFADLMSPRNRSKGAQEEAAGTAPGADVAIKSSFQDARMGVHKVPLESFPLGISVAELFSRHVFVDEPAVQEFSITNQGKEKMAYTLIPVKTDKYVVDFDIPFGVIKPGYSVNVKASLTALCTKSTVISITIICKGAGSKYLKLLLSFLSFLLNSILHSLLRILHNLILY